MPTSVSRDRRIDETVVAYDEASIVANLPVVTSCDANFRDQLSKVVCGERRLQAEAIENG